MFIPVLGASRARWCFGSVVLLLLGAIPLRVTGQDSAPAALTLHVERAAPTDLAVSGRLTGVPSGETRYVRWADLRSLPTAKLKLEGEFVAGEQEVTLVYLSELWRRLPLAAGADTLLASCTDDYAGIFREPFIREYRPFLVLEINGEGPDRWPPEGMKFNPGPYVISVSALVVPAVATLLDASHKRPWAVAAVEVANYAERFREIHTGPWASLSAAAQAGREIWLNSCLSCHAGPGATFGGSKSKRPFPVVAAHAGYNVDYFKSYVRNPQSVLPGATMEGHPHYTDAQLDELIAFITAK